MEKTSTLALLLALLAAHQETVSARLDLPQSLPTLPTMLQPSNAATIVSTNGSLVELPEIMYFPDDNGDPVPGKIHGTAMKPSPAIPQDVLFKLYTKGGPTEGEFITTGDAESLRNSYFNASQDTFIVTHGFLQSINADIIQSIKTMYLGFHEGNVIAVDWSKISKNWLYFIVKMQTMEVGQFVAAFTAFLAREGGADVSKMHLIGHSLGAHVVGIAGKNIYLTVGKKVGRITGLDPAGPLFSVIDKTHRLDRDDADFVDVIHTCGGWLGMSSPIGHADFFPNGGIMRQPGCSLDFVTAGVCSHSRSWQLFAESIQSRRFLARPCSSYVNYKMDNCNHGHVVPMGQHTHHRVSGNFYLKTAEFSPFAMG